MINTNKIKGRMAELQITQKKLRNAKLKGGDKSKKSKRIGCAILLYFILMQIFDCIPLIKYCCRMGKANCLYAGVSVPE